MGKVEACGGSQGNSFMYCSNSTRIIMERPIESVFGAYQGLVIKNRLCFFNRETLIAGKQFDQHIGIHRSRLEFQKPVQQFREATAIPRPLQSDFIVDCGNR